MPKIIEALKVFLKDPLFLRRWELPHSPRSQRDNQLSIRVGFCGNKLYYGDGDVHRFVQDLYSGIMPFMHQAGQREKYPAKVEPASPEKEKFIANGISSQSYRRSLTDALCEFVRTTSQSLFLYGIILFELVYEKDADESIASFRFEHLDEKYIFRFLGNYYQIIPWWVAQKRCVRVQIIKIPSEKILRIEFPKRIGGRRRLQRILKRLWQSSREIIPQFQMEALSGNQNINFKLEDYSRGKYLASAKVTSIFGWDQGQTSANYITEYYSFVRYLREIKTQAIVREEIISRVNDLLNGPILNLKAKVSIENLPTVESVEEQEKLMNKGNIKFIDIYNALKM